ncbi:MAG: hypothetical protein FJZ01_28230, partial [Candidatus Sericytochromatia bacterium]|nr:hypothetical protein [Candidatus Tanganyikabacteria bacterium]
DASDDDAAPDLVPFIVSVNLHRRHLNESQRAMVAARLANLSDGQRADYRSANLPTLPDIPLPPPPITQARAAQLLNVGERSVRAARKVLNEAEPELAQAVAGGRIPVSTAADLTALPQGEQVEVVTRHALVRRPWLCPRAAAKAGRLLISAGGTGKGQGRRPPR